MGKIIQAKDILKQKGYVQNKFDTKGFMEAVADYFVKNDVSAELLLMPFRFLDIKREDLGDDIIVDTYNPYKITPEEEKCGFKVQTERLEGGAIKFVQELWNRDFDGFQAQRNAGILFPRIIIDRPFIENAVYTLRLMGGYVVRKETKKSRKLYWVTLI